MKFSVKNIGKITQADIEIKGVTIIAGQNNTGKSTMGKALFAMFNSCYNVDEFIKNTKIESFAKILREYCEDNYIVSRNDDNTYDLFSQRQVDNIPYLEFASNLYNLNKEKTKKEDVKHLIVDFLKFHDADIESHMDFSKIDMCVDEIYKRFIVEDKYSVAARINRNLNEEFIGQIRNINCAEDSELALQIGRQKTTLRYDDKGIHIEDGIMKLRTQVAYVDDPFIIDEIETKYSVNKYKNLPSADFKEHKRHLLEMLLKETSHNTVEEIITGDRLQLVYDCLGKISHGQIVTEHNTRMYKEDGNSFRLSNLSTGLKTFVIIKMLLLNGAIEKNGTIILDEPEIHLHPQWQLIFAEAIILMHKEFNLHILINTHSPYFLDAIEVYSKKHAVDKKCKYYLSCEHENKKGYTLEDVTHDTQAIYSLLASPFQMLENEEWQ